MSSGVGDGDVRPRPRLPREMGHETSTQNSRAAEGVLPYAPTSLSS